MFAHHGNEVAFESAVALCLCATVVSACANTLTPSGASQRLEIVPVLGALELGTAQTLTAEVPDGLGGRRPVTALWSSDRPDVLSITQEGSVQALRIGKATLTATYMSDAATLTVQAVRNYSGSWSGAYRVTRCVRLSGTGPNVCITGVTFPIHITLSQLHGHGSGTVERFTNDGVLFESGTIQISVNDVGDLTLSGTAYPVDAGHDGQAVFNVWDTTIDSTSTAMEGTFRRTWTFTNGFGPQQIQEDCELASLTRK